MLSRACIFALSLHAWACASNRTQPAPDAALGSDATPPAAGTPAAAPALWFGLTESDVLAGTPPPPSFDVLAVRDLWIRYTTIQATLPDPALLRIQTIMPSGLEFRDYLVGFARDPRQSPQVLPPDLATPVQTSPIRPMGERSALLYGIAISGTDYVRHSMPGRWRVRASVDGVASSAIEGTVELRVGP
jgi:hypothetical protein